MTATLTVPARPRRCPSAGDGRLNVRHPPADPLGDARLLTASPPAAGGQRPSHVGRVRASRPADAAGPRSAASGPCRGNPAPPARSRACPLRGRPRLARRGGLGSAPPPPWQTHRPPPRRGSATSSAFPQCHDLSPRRRMPAGVRRQDRTGTIGVEAFDLAYGDRIPDGRGLAARLRVRAGSTPAGNRPRRPAPAPAPTARSVWRRGRRSSTGSLRPGGNEPRRHLHGRRLIRWRPRLPVIGYVKTHHRRQVAGADDRENGRGLPARGRPRVVGGSWAGIACLEMPSGGRPGPRAGYRASRRRCATRARCASRPGVRGARGGARHLPSSTGPRRPSV